MMNIPHYDEYTYGESTYDESFYDEKLKEPRTPRTPGCIVSKAKDFVFT